MKNNFKSTLILKILLKAEIKNIVSLSILLILTSSCITSDNKAQKDDSVAKPSNFSSNFKLSPQTKLFIQDLRQEIENEDKTTFKSSSKLQNKYNLRKLNNVFYVNGFIKVNNNYDEDVLSKLNINVNSSKGEIKTISIPIKSIPKFLRTDGIEYFEISQQVKNQMK